MPTNLILNLITKLCIPNLNQTILLISSSNFLYQLNLDFLIFLATPKFSMKQLSSVNMQIFNTNRLQLQIAVFGQKQFPYKSIIINKNNLKVSYSCMENINSIINTQDKNILFNTKQQTKSSTCIKKPDCYLNNYRPKSFK